MINIYSIDDDNVINGKFITGKTDYEFAIKRLYPLVNKLDIQRKLQNPTFYKRLRLDILKGCIMPPITLAFVLETDKLPEKLKDAEGFINKNIGSAFILDGIQRINALNQAYSTPELELTFPLNRPLFINLIICRSMDNLLYRMITLNNGQRPMTANHQIEILLGNVYEFDDLDVIIQTEKEKGKKGKIKHSFDKASIIKAYMAFISNTTAIDNKKIIESKLDELIAKRIIDSTVTEDELEFYDIMALVNSCCNKPFLKKWFTNENNIIGFCVGIKKSFEFLQNLDTDEIENGIKIFEQAFASLKLSTIKLSRERRNLSRFVIEHFKQIKDLHDLELLDLLNEKVL